MYVKIFAGILESSIASETPLRRFFMDLLLIADQDGNVIATRDAIAKRLGVPRSEVDWGIDRLLEPDAESGNPDNDGRRLEALEGRGYGWRILNYGFYRDIKTASELRAANAKRQAEFRARKASSNVTLPLRNESNPSEAEAGSDTKAGERGSKDAAPEGAPPQPADKCPVQEIVNLYHEILPQLPACRKITPGRRSSICQRWRDDMTDLEDWRVYFTDYVKVSDFLMGRRPGTNGRPVFRADIGWLVNPTNYAKIIEGKFHGEVS